MSHPSVTTAAGWLRGRRPSVSFNERGYVAAGTAAVLAAVAVAGVLGTGATRAVTALRDGGGWLRNEATGTVTHVNGYAGRADATTKVARPGDPFTVIQRADGAYVEDTRTHMLTRVDGSTLAATALPSSGVAGVQVVTSSTSTDTWLVDPATGSVQQVDPTTLQPLGRQLSLGAPAGTSVLSASGDLWAALPSKGAVAHVAPQAVLPQLVQVGAPGNAITVVADEAGDRVVAVDASTCTTTPLLGGGGDGHLDLGSAAPAGQTPVAAVGDQGVVVATQGSQVAEAAPGPGAAAAAAPGPSLPAGARITEVEVLGTTAYLLDAAGKQVIPYDLTTQQLEPALVLPDHALPDLELSGGVLFVNDPLGPTALAITSSGSVTTVQKYTEAPAPRGPTTQHSGTGGATKGGTTSPTPGPTGGQGPVSTGPSGPATGPSQPTGPSPGPGTSGSPTTPPRQASVPGAPTITALSAGDGSAAAQWDAAADHGAAITAYRILVSGRSPQTVPGSTLSATIGGLANGRQVTVRVQAVNSVGAGPASAPRTVTPTASAPTAPGDVRVTLSGRTVTVRWSAASASGTPIGHYDVRVAPTSGKALTTSTTDPATTSASVGDLVYGARYQVSVTAVLVDGTDGPPGTPADGKLGSSGDPVVATTTPGAPRGVSASSPASSELTVTWTPPASDGYAAITHYVVTVDGGKKATLAAGTRTYTWHDLTNGTAHRATVVAQNANGSGPGASDTATPKAPPLKREQIYRCQSVTYDDIYSFIDSSSCTPTQNWHQPGKAAFKAVSSHISGSQPVVNCADPQGRAKVERLGLGSCRSGSAFETVFYGWASKPADHPDAVEIHEYRYGGASNTGYGYWYGTTGQSPPSRFTSTGVTFWS